MAKASRHVVASPGGGWSVRKYGAERASGVFATQADAIARGRDLARREGANLYIHRADGTIREKENYADGDTSHGKH